MPPFPPSSPLYTIRPSRLSQRDSAFWSPSALNQRVEARVAGLHRGRRSFLRVFFSLSFCRRPRKYPPAVSSPSPQPLGLLSIFTSSPPLLADWRSKVSQPSAFIPLRPSYRTAKPQKQFTLVCRRSRTWWRDRPALPPILSPQNATAIWSDRTFVHWGVATDFEIYTYIYTTGCNSTITDALHDTDRAVLYRLEK